MRKPLIIGFDPGTTAALAVLDTKGELLYLHSRKGFSKNEIIEQVTARGKPLIVAADRNPLPRSVEKLSSSLGSKVYYPNSSLTSVEKSSLVKIFKIKIKNDHERDALAAAYKAFRVYASLFNKVKNALNAYRSGKYYPDVIERVIFEEDDNINEAIENVLLEKRQKEKEGGVVEKKAAKITDKNVFNEIKQLKLEVRRNENDIQILKNYNEELKKRLGKTRQRLEYYKKRFNEGETAGMESIRMESRNIERSLEQMKNLRDIELEGYFPVIEIEKVKGDDVEKLHRTIGLKKRVVFCTDLSNVQILNDYNILALIATKKPGDDIFEKINFPIILENDIILEEKNGYKAVEFEKLENKLRTAKKEGLVQWLKSYRKRKL